MKKLFQGAAKKSRAVAELESDSSRIDIKTGRTVLESGQVIAISGLFDASYYTHANPDLADSGLTPLNHYLQRGWKKGRRPHFLFDVTAYLKQNPDVAKSGSEPLSHYLLLGWKEGRNPNPLFDVRWYREQYQEAAEVEPLGFYLHGGWRKGHQPHALFHTSWYLKKYPEVRKQDHEPLHHYLTSGWRKGYQPHPLFLTAWYLQQYPEVREQGREPLRHFLFSGWKKGYQPHPLFDTTFYLENSPRLREDGINPLVHFLKFGAWEDLDPNPHFSTSKYLDRNPKLRTLLINPLVQHVLNQDGDIVPPGTSLTVIVPIYNALDEVLDCLGSLLRQRVSPYEILLMDDCSPNPQMQKQLSAFAEKHPFVHYIRNIQNLGYTANVNRGISLVKRGDILLLNSDTVVTPGWAEKLRAAAYSKDSVATVTPLSNAAGAFSIPENNTVNELKEGLGPDQYNQILEACTRRLRPSAPTGNGFCLYITRKAIQQVGAFDEESFPRGYGEENDFCQRALKQGFANLVDDATYIFHHRSASFQGQKATILEESRRVLSGLHPNYKADVTKWLTEDPLSSLRLEFRERLASFPSDSTPGNTGEPLLYILHDGQGGTRHTAEDLAKRVQSVLPTYFLETATREWRLWKYSSTGAILLTCYFFSDPWDAMQPLSEGRKDVLRGILDEFEFKLVHIRHLIGNAPEIIELIKEKDISVVFSFHDFYTICPTINLLDENLQYCGGRCTPGEGPCALSKKWFPVGIPNLKHDRVYQYRQRMESCLKHADMYVTTSESAKKVLLENFPGLSAGKLCVIEHGRDLEQVNLCRPLVSGEKTRVVSFGSLGRMKGVHLIDDLLRLNAEAGGPLEFHFLGPISTSSKRFSTQAICHGSYQREDLPALIREIGPSLALILSVWPETYCHTLTEAWSMGLPVAASNIGVLQERLQNQGGGWLVDYTDAEACWKQLVSICQDPDEHRRMMKIVSEMPMRTIQEMSSEYIALYQRLSQGTPILP